MSLLLLFPSSGGAGSQSLTQGTRFDNANQFYAPTVTRGTVTLTPPLFTNANSFYSPTVTAGAAALIPARLDNAQAFYSPTVTTGSVTLQAGLFSSSNTFYSPAVTAGSLTLLPGLVTNINVFYAPTASQGAGAQSLLPALLSNTNNFYAPTVTFGASALYPGGLENANQFYSHAVTQSIYTITYEQAQQLYEIYMLHGLLDPLSVSETARTAGLLSQTVVDSAGTVTVSKTADGAAFSGDPGTLIEELSAIHGLTESLVVTGTTRNAGSISQSFATAGSTTTVTRL